MILVPLVLWFYLAAVHQSMDTCQPRDMWTDRCAGVAVGESWKRDESFSTFGGR